MQKFRADVRPAFQMLGAIPLYIPRVLWKETIEKMVYKFVLDFFFTYQESLLGVLLCVGNSAHRCIQSACRSYVDAPRILESEGVFLSNPVDKPVLLR